MLDDFKFGENEMGVFHPTLLFVIEELTTCDFSNVIT